MKLCQKCGTELEDEIIYCPNCDHVNRISSPIIEEETKNETNLVLWSLASFILPFIGIYIAIAWRKSKPKTAFYSTIALTISLTGTIIYWILELMS